MLFDMTEETRFRDEGGFEVVVSSGKERETSQVSTREREVKAWKDDHLLAGLGSGIRSEGLEQSLERPNDAFWSDGLRRRMEGSRCFESC